jgi:hypothetical protein
MDWRGAGRAISLTVVLCAIAVFFANPVHADPFAPSKEGSVSAKDDPFATNSDVLKTCSAPQATAQYSLCLGYIHGLLRRDELLRWTNPNLAYACELPQGVEIDQVRAVIVKYLQDRPETWHWTGAGSSLYAVKRAFCRQAP